MGKIFGVFQICWLQLPPSHRQHDWCRRRPDRHPSYTFDAKSTDYASRFRLVFATGNNSNEDNFAFINGAGNLSNYYFGFRDENEFVSPIMPAHFLEDNQPAPLGSGIAVLVGLGAAYLVGKKREE